MNEALFNGYTIYINSHNGQLQGLGLRSLGKEGMTTIELSEEELNQFSENYPAICKQLGDDATLQMYRNFNYTYEAMIGRLTKEGPYGEADTFDVIESCGSLLPEEALLGVEESLALVSDKKAKIFERRYTLQKLYRPYGSDKYVSRI